MSIYEESLKFHKELKGKLEVTSRVKITNEKDLSLAYTPGVAEPCREIHKDPSTAYLYTRKWNTVAVISDGTAVLGLGDIGPLASLPVMEGKSILFNEPYLSFGASPSPPFIPISKYPPLIVVCSISPFLLIENVCFTSLKKLLSHGNLIMKKS